MVIVAAKSTTPHSSPIPPFITVILFFPLPLLLDLSQVICSLNEARVPFLCSSGGDEAEVQPVEPIFHDCQSFLSAWNPIRNFEISPE